MSDAFVCVCVCMFFQRDEFVDKCVCDAFIPVHCMLLRP